MKWIGQHIWDFISRFRSDVYLEATETGTIASGGNLGLDSNNKIVKASAVSSVTVADSTTNEYYPIVFHDESNNLLDDTGALEYNPSYPGLLLAGSGAINLSLSETADNNNDVHINFYNLKGGAAGDDDDNLGTLSFYGRNDAGSPASFVYGSFTTSIADASDSDEAGAMSFKVATEGTERQALTATGDGASSKVDVGIGYGTTSTTTIAGTLTMGSTAAMTNAGLLSVANQSNITGLGTITSGTWTGTAIADAYVANDLTISGGTVNDSIIGGSTPAAITGTTVDATTDFTVGTTVITDDQIQFTPSVGDTATISAGSNGRMTLSTSDAGGNQAYVELSPDGDIKLSPATNKIVEIFDFHTTNFENTYSSGHHGGKVLRHSNGTSDLTLGQLYYLRSNGHWVSAYADNDDGGGPGYGDYEMLGVGLGNPQSVGVLIEGFVRIPYTEILNNPGSGNVDGLPLYVSAGTAGHFDFTAPSDSGDYVRIVGYAIDDYDTGSGNMDVLVYFNPSKTYIEIA
tara:strand:- start:1928 stop:3478 length:1551 start_codon:yes stop_codon:yes gene_type:complete